jgi:hypothetical protein
LAWGEARNGNRYGSKLLNSLVLSRGKREVEGRENILAEEKIALDLF